MLSACGATGDDLAARALRINELVADDEGFLIDEHGHTTDWIELVNAGAREVDLSRARLSRNADPPVALPSLRLAPGERVVLFADGAPEEGPLHLPLRLPRGGATLRLLAADGGTIDDVAYPALAVNQAFARFPDAGGAFARCRYATPRRDNTGTCGPPRPPDPPEDVTFAPFSWPAEFPAAIGPLIVSEAALRPAAFVEVQNIGAAPVDPAVFSLRVAAFAPGEAWPGPAAGVELGLSSLPPLAPGARGVIAVDPSAVAALAAGPEFEGVLTIFDRTDGVVVDRLDFMRWPADTALARAPRDGRAAGLARYCRVATPGAANDVCDPVASRDVGGRLHHLRAAGDFAALGAGGTETDMIAVKFLIDLQAGGVVHLIGSRDYALHYSFVRDQIERLPPLDRCDPVEAQRFYEGWVEFSEREYLRIEGRRFLMGTLVHHGGADLRTVEFAVGDKITGPMMRQAFFTVAARLPDPERWVVRPQDAEQVAAIRAVEGTVPVVAPSAPFRGLTFQPLNPTVGYGILRFVPAAELEAAALGPDVILVTDDVPNDVAMIGGLVTEAFQTPLAHVAILSRNRGTPNMALRDARRDPRLEPFFDKLVRLAVTGAGFEVREAAPAEAAAFWEARRPQGPRREPRLDVGVRGLVDLAGRGVEDLPVVGAKAAQFGEMTRVALVDAACFGPVPTPAGAFAIPLVHSVEHLAASGAAALLASRQADPAFVADGRVRAQALAEVRAAILTHPVDPTLLVAVEGRIRERFGARRVRLRSSSNTEDLAGFSGAGLYTSVSAAVDDPSRRVADGLRTVWASLWSPRAYDERELALIDHGKTAMGVLVHEAYSDVERANGVAISRNINDPIRSDVYTLNSQAGEASVTNPAPGVFSEQALYSSWPTPRLDYLSRSSLIPGAVVTLAEAARLACVLRGLHDHLRRRLDPDGENRWFAVDVEWKLVGPARELVVKQARPYSFGRAEIPSDCREF